jgi:hypothetical protein
MPIETPDNAAPPCFSQGIRHRHYLITRHAVERYSLRVGASVETLFSALDSAVLAVASQAFDWRVQQQIRKCEQEGGYALVDPARGIYFFVKQNGDGSHAVTTVMTYAVMTYSA